MLRTWWCKKLRALAWTISRSSCRVTVSSSSVRIGDFTWQAEARNEEKSWWPSSRLAARCIAASSRRRFTCQMRLASTAGGAARLEIT